jgi:hypothetical protein
MAARRLPKNGAIDIGGRRGHSRDAMRHKRSNRWHFGL